jgi:hypothetical protein
MVKKELCISQRSCSHLKENGHNQNSKRIAQRRNPPPGVFTISIQKFLKGGNKNRTNRLEEIYKNVKKSEK